MDEQTRRYDVVAREVPQEFSRHGLWAQFLLVLVFWLMAVSILGPVFGSLWNPTAAAAEMPADLANREPDELYQFSWLDPDKKVYVLQNRRYTKTARFQVSALAGVAIGETYRNTFDLDGRAGYFFSERIGIEGFYAKVFNRANNAAHALVQASSTALPVIREVRASYGALFVWSPFYAKINIFNTILYFDWTVSGGLGRMQTALDTNTIVGGPAKFIDQDVTSFIWGTGHQYYFHDHWLVRLDFMSQHYQAPAFGRTGEDTWFSNTTFRAGAGYRF